MVKIREILSQENRFSKILSVFVSFLTHFRIKSKIEKHVANMNYDIFIKITKYKNILKNSQTYIFINGEHFYNNDLCKIYLLKLVLKSTILFGNSKLKKR